MIRCHESDRIQDYLDGELPATDAARVREHLTTCDRCAAEVALYRRVFASLDDAPLFEPPPAVTERVLARVLPSRIRRRRRAAAIAWGYAGLVVASVTALFTGASHPAGHALLTAASSAASRAVVEGGLFVLNTVSASVLRVVELWRLADSAGARFAPLGRALAAIVSQPAFLLTVVAAVGACALLLLWMRPRARAAVEEVRHVGLLGF